MVGGDSSSVVPGLLLLISAGTVLYVALCHIIPECFNVHEHHDDNVSLEGNNVQKVKISKADEIIQLTILCVGLLLPLVLVYTLPED